MPKARPEKEASQALYAEGLTPKEIAQAMDVPASTIKNWVAALPKHSTGFSRRRHGTAAARVARLTGREGEAIRLEMEAKENDPCFFCGSNVFAGRGWFTRGFHHHSDGTIERVHGACNAIRRHQAITNV